MSDKYQSDNNHRLPLDKAKLMLDAKVVVEHYDQIIGGIERTDPSVDDFVMTVEDYETLRDFALQEHADASKGLPDSVQELQTLRGRVDAKLHRLVLGDPTKGITR